MEDPREYEGKPAEKLTSGYDQQKVDLAVYGAEGQSDERLGLDRLNITFESASGLSRYHAATILTKEVSICRQ